MSKFQNNPRYKEGSKAENQFPDIYPYPLVNVESWLLDNLCETKHPRNKDNDGKFVNDFLRAAPDYLDQLNQCVIEVKLWRDGIFQFPKSKFELYQQWDEYLLSRNYRLYLGLYNDRTGDIAMCVMREVIDYIKGSKRQFKNIYFSDGNPCHDLTYSEIQKLKNDIL